MRLRTVALALALSCGLGGMAEAARKPAVRRAAVKRPKRPKVKHPKPKKPPKHRGHVG